MSFKIAPESELLLAEIVKCYWILMSKTRFIDFSKMESFTYIFIMYRMNSDLILFKNETTLTKSSELKDKQMELQKIKKLLGRSTSTAGREHLFCRGLASGTLHVPWVLPQVKINLKSKNI